MVGLARLRVTMGAYYTAGFIWVVTSYFKFSNYYLFKIMFLAIFLKCMQQFYDRVDVKDLVYIFKILVLGISKYQYST